MRRRNLGVDPTGKQKGDRKVADFIHVNSGVTCEILLRGTKFYAVLLERQFEAPDANILRADLTDYAEHWLQMEWFPIIKVTIGDNYRYSRDDPEGEGVQLTMKRFYLSVSPAGRSFRVWWEIDEDHRKAEMESYIINRRGNEVGNKLLLIGLPLKAPCKLDRDGAYLMDYTEDVWQSLTNISEGIRAMRHRLSEMVSSRKGLNQLLTASGAPLQLQHTPVRQRTRGAGQ